LGEAVPVPGLDFKPEILSAWILIGKEADLEGSKR
jgi:hypothetical protein